MDAISQTTFSNVSSWMRMFDFWLNFHLSLFLRVQSTIFQHWFIQWLGADQATSNYLNQWWLVYWRIFASLGLNELKGHMIHYKTPVRSIIFYQIHWDPHGYWKCHVTFQSRYCHMLHQWHIRQLFVFIFIILQYNDSQNSSTPLQTQPQTHLTCTQVNIWWYQLPLVQNLFYLLRGIIQNATIFFNTLLWDLASSQWQKLVSHKIYSTSLIQQPGDKMAAILQTIYSDTFSWMKSFVFWLKFLWSLFLRAQLTIT